MDETFPRTPGRSTAAPPKGTRRASRGASIATAALIASAALFSPGCAATPGGASPSDPAVAAAHQEAWYFPGAKNGRQLVTAHYDIHTTIESDEVVGKLGQLMEGAFTEYRKMAPSVTLTDQPLYCYIFESRRQWAQFTQSRTGADAPIYLRINRGGYTAGDWYVAYFIGDLGTYSVAAHEGFHQFLARHFKSRPPPFLEEGMACTFEDVHWEGGQPRWDPAVNPTRLAGLCKTFAAKGMIPLSDLCAMHAGQVVNSSPAKIEAFYAQSWAFVRFCREAEGGKYRAGFEKMLEDCSRGRAYDPAGDPAADDWHWDPASAKPLLVRYLGGDFAALDRDYRAFVERVARAAVAAQPVPAS